MQQSASSSLVTRRLAYVNIGKGQVDNAVESARPGEGSIQSCWPVGGSHDHHACVVLKAIHLCQQLIDGVHRLCTCQEDVSCQAFETAVYHLDDPQCAGRLASH